MASVTRLSFLLCAVTAISAVLLPAKTIQHYRIQLQQYGVELYAELRQLNGESPEFVNYLDESSGLLTLTVYTNQVPAKIEIENVDTPYHAEMLLPEGSYEIIVSAYGYASTRLRINLYKGNQVFYARLR